MAPTTDSRRDRPRKYRVFSGTRAREKDPTSKLEPFVTVIDKDKKLVLPITFLARVMASPELDEPFVDYSEDDISCSDFSKEMIGNQSI